MSLRGFHILFITASSLMTATFGVWALGTGTFRALGLLSSAVTLGLVLYGAWFLRTIRTRAEEERRRRQLIRPLAVGLVAMTLGSPEAWACSVCYGDAQGPLIDAARLGVWLLFGLVVAVQLGIVMFFVTLRRRARDYERRHPQAAC